MCKLKKNFKCVRIECVNLNLESDRNIVLIFWVYCLIFFGFLLVFLVVEIFWGEGLV